MKCLICYLLSVPLLLSHSVTAQQYDDPIPVHDTFSIYSNHVKESRNINIWLPPDYKNGTGTFPVMYMADGGIVQEDFPHIANTFAELITEGSIPPMILVGIQNTQRRRDLTGPTEVAADKEIAPIVGGSANFRAFIKEELIPEINKRYRTNDKRGILGESLSGLFVMETFLRTPEMFDYYIAFDPSLWWNNHFLVRNANDLLTNFPEDNKVLWFAASGVKGMAADTKSLAKVLQKKNLQNLRWTYVSAPKEKHSTIFRATKVQALKWALGKQ